MSWPDLMTKFLVVDSRDGTDIPKYENVQWTDPFSDRAESRSIKKDSSTSNSWMPVPNNYIKAGYIYYTG